MKNIFIEGMQGTGKTTLLRKLAQRLDGYQAYWEGDISPVELAWCSYMTQEEYDKTFEKFCGLQQELEENTKVEGKYRIVSYTRILAEDRGFYEYMERYEIYNGRKNFEEFKDIIMRRFQDFHGEGNIFECSFFQNIIEDLMLFYELSERAIIEFYKDVFAELEQEKFLMLYLHSENFVENLMQIKKERVDENGREIWFEMMLQYLNASPYGKKKPFRKEADMVEHFRRRLKLEEKLIREVLGERCIVLSAKAYDIDKVMEQIIEGKL